MSTTVKHRNFVSESIGNKLVTDIPGIGETLGKRLNEHGFNKATHVLGQFLILKKNRQLFISWLKESCGANAKQCNDCFQCLEDWCNEFM